MQDNSSMKMIDINITQDVSIMQICDKSNKLQGLYTIIGFNNL